MTEETQIIKTLISEIRFELDWDKMKSLVDDFTGTIDRIEQEIGDFIKQVRNLEAASDGTNGAK